jgi:hypothetical protein
MLLNRRLGCRASCPCSATGQPQHSRRLQQGQIPLNSADPNPTTSHDPRTATAARKPFCRPMRCCSCRQAGTACRQLRCARMSRGSRPRWMGGARRCCVPPRSAPRGGAAPAAAARRARAAEGWRLLWCCLSGRGSSVRRRGRLCCWWRRWVDGGQSLAPATALALRGQNCERRTAPLPVFSSYEFFVPGSRRGSGLCHHTHYFH